MSVIVSRALPDARDGLKPVHRRILYSMHDLNMTPERSYSKCARVVGDVLGRFHPHGDASVYMALVRMAQPFSMGLMLVDGQGNFGSVDGDMPASMRYTEARMAPAAVALMADIDKDTVDFQPNYDEKELEPVVLPSRIPNLLVNGAGGIAVGMATNIPPHNLGEGRGCGPGPAGRSQRFPTTPCWTSCPVPTSRRAARSWAAPRRAMRCATGADRSWCAAAPPSRKSARTARPSWSPNCRSRSTKQTLIERIAEMVREKRLEGISDVRDESDRQGMRIVIELKRGRLGRCDPEPAVALHRHAVVVRRQYAGAETTAGPSRWACATCCRYFWTSAKRSSSAASSSS